MNRVTIRKVATGYVVLKDGAPGLPGEEHAFETYASLSKWLKDQLEPLTLAPKVDSIFDKTTARPDPFSTPRRFEPQFTLGGGVAQCGDAIGFPLQPAPRLSDLVRG